MSVTPTGLLNQFASPASNDPWASTSISPSADTVVIAAVATRMTDPQTGQVSISGNGLTWTLVGGVAGWTAATQWGYAVWEGRGTPSSGAITITPNGTDVMEAVRLQVVEYAGADLTAPIPAANIETIQVGSGVGNVVTTPTFTDTVASDSALHAFFGIANNGFDATPRSGWTETYEGIGGGQVGCYTHTRTSPDTAAACDWGDSAGQRIGIAFEILAAGGGPTAVSGEVTFSSFDLLGEMSNLGVTVNPEGELVLATFDLLADDFTVYVSGFSEIDLGTFSTTGGLSGFLVAVVSGTIEFGTEMTLAAASTLQRIGAATLEFGVNLMGTVTGGDPVLTAGIDLVRTGATFVRGVIRDVISSITRRY